MTIVDPASFYKGYQINYEENTIEVLAESKKQPWSLYDEWEQVFSNFREVNVCLSGGIDSQFVLSVLRKLNKTVNVYIFSFVWEDCVFNSPDVLHAIRYCDRFGYSYTNIEIDFKHFVETNTHLKYCIQYHTASPQISLHLKMLDLIDNDHPIFLGTEIPLLQYSFSAQKSVIGGILTHPYATSPFLKYSNDNKKCVIKDMFAINSTTYYLGFEQLLATTQKHKLVFPSELYGRGGGLAQPLRNLFYCDLGADIMTPLLKNTGFEMLKLHLAKKTGVYNQFDVDYRYPVEGILKQQSWYKPDRFRIKTRTADLEKLRQDHEDFCKTTSDIKPIELYNFIL